MPSFYGADVFLPQLISGCGLAYAFANYFNAVYLAIVVTKTYYVIDATLEIKTTLQPLLRTLTLIGLLFGAILIAKYNKWLLILWIMHMLTVMDEFARVDLLIPGAAFILGSLLPRNRLTFLSGALVKILAILLTHASNNLLQAILNGIIGCVLIACVVYIVLDALAQKRTVIGILIEPSGERSHVVLEIE